MKNIEALKRACKKVGLEFRENQKTYKWYGRWVQDYHGSNAAYKLGINPEDYGKCEHAIGIPGNNTAYEIGICRNNEGKMVMVWDFWGGGNGLESVAGKDCHKLVQAYSAEVTAETLTQQGYIQSEYTTNADGEIELVYQRY
jgi:hypothetical protein